MRRAIRMPPERSQHLAHWSVGGHWITGRLDRTEAETALRIGAKAAAQIHFVGTGLLKIVHTVGRRLPCIHFGTLNWRTIRGKYAAPEDHRLSRRTIRDVRIHCERGRALAKERP